jgi:hypothetical protein
MNLAVKFNESYKSSNGDDLVIGLYAAFNYGSNSFCYDQMERLLKGANDSGPQQKILGL